MPYTFFAKIYIKSNVSLFREENRKMNSASIQHLVAMIVYMAIVIEIGRASCRERV